MVVKLLFDLKHMIPEWHCYNGLCVHEDIHVHWTHVSKGHFYVNPWVEIYGLGIFAVLILWNIANNLTVYLNDCFNSD